MIRMGDFYDKRFRVRPKDNMATYDRRYLMDVVDEIFRTIEERNV